METERTLVIHRSRRDEEEKGRPVIALQSVFIEVNNH